MTGIGPLDIGILVTIVITVIGGSIKISRWQGGTNKSIHDLEVSVFDQDTGEISLQSKDACSEIRDTYQQEFCNKIDVIVEDVAELK